MHVSNEKGEPETLRKELSVTVEDVLRIEALCIDPWTEPLLTFDPRELQSSE